MHSWIKISLFMLNACLNEQKKKIQKKKMKNFIFEKKRTVFEFVWLCSNDNRFSVDMTTESNAK